MKDALITLGVRKDALVALFVHFPVTRRGRKFRFRWVRCDHAATHRDGESPRYVDVETEATVVREFAGLNLPGLLQTEPYIRALFDRDPLPRTAKVLEDQVAVRLIRQRRLTDDEEPLELVAIVDEAALRRRIGGTEVMRGQLEHLIEAASMPTVTLQVLPLRDGAHSAMDGASIVLSFPEDYNPELLYVSYATGALHIEDAEQLWAARLVFDQLRTEALGSADSVALIERVLTELDDR